MSDTEKIFMKLCEVALQKAKKEEINPVVFAIGENYSIPIPVPPFENQEEKEISFGMVKEVVKNLSPKAVAVFFEAYATELDSGKRTESLIGLYFSGKKRIIKIWTITGKKGNRKLTELKQGEGKFTLNDYLDYGTFFQQEDYIY